MQNRCQQKQDYGYLKCHRQLQIQAMFCCSSTECYSGQKAFQMQHAAISGKCLLALQDLFSLKQEEYYLGMSLLATFWSNSVPRFKNINK